MKNCLIRKKPFQTDAAAQDQLIFFHHSSSNSRQLLDHRKRNLVHRTSSTCRYGDRVSKCFSLSDSISSETDDHTHPSCGIILILNQCSSNTFLMKVMTKSSRGADKHCSLTADSSSTRRILIGDFKWIKNNRKVECTSICYRTGSSD